VVDGRTLLRDVSFYLPPGAILGVVGPNGTGKTTLFKILSRQLEPDAGTLIVGDTVKLGYVQQTRESLDAKNTIFDEIAQGSEYIPIGTHEQVRC
jgi:ATPase subunit of ABC transporter with duplicated ATPase domains